MKKLGLLAVALLVVASFNSDTSYPCHPLGDLGPCTHPAHSLGDLGPCGHTYFDAWGNLCYRHINGDLYPCTHAAHYNGDLYPCTHNCW